jgi:hypothetical protein
MKRNRIAAVVSLAVSAGLVGLAIASPSSADPDDSFLDWLAEAGITGIDPATADEVGRQVCPMLAEPGQRVADVAAEVADAIGRPLGPATTFTGPAIDLFCPGVVASLAEGESPIPLGLLGR